MRRLPHGIPPLLFAGLLLATLVKPDAAEIKSLPEIRREVLAYVKTAQVPGKPLGFYRDRPGTTNAPSLYATCDVAHIRTVMGEDLQQTLTAAQRQAWIAHINSFARPDGTYGPAIGGHSPHHANGMVIGALGALGGQQLRPVQLYDAFDTPEKVGPWLEKVDWRKQWSGSHLFWGGMHCFSLSRRCTDAWRKTVFDWLDANLDSQTGWWRKGTPHAGPFEPLGGGAHIWPIYQHHGRRFPYPERVIDGILALQRTNGCWLGYGNYMDLDALCGLAYMRSLAPEHRAVDVLEAVRRHGRGWIDQWPAFLARKPTLHGLLAGVGVFGLLQQFLPETFVDDVRWTDIFSDARLYRTRQVEVQTNIRAMADQQSTRQTIKVVEPVKIWSGNVVPKSADIPLLKGVEFHIIKKHEPEKDGYLWLHGVGLAWHKGKLYVGYSNNGGRGSNRNSAELAVILIGELRVEP